MATMTRQRGFSLVELMVALVLMLVVLAIASRLVLDAQASIAHSGRRYLDISVDQAFDQLRYDARASTHFEIPFGVSGGLWARDDALRFIGHLSGDLIVYELADGELLRHVFQAGYLDPVATRPMLRQVKTFRFRSAPDTSRSPLEVEVTYHETPPMTARTSAGQKAAIESSPRVVGLILTPRLIDQSHPETWW